MTGKIPNRPNRAVASRLLAAWGDPTTKVAGARRADVLRRIEAGQRRTVQADVCGPIDRAAADRLVARIRDGRGLTHVIVVIDSHGGDDESGFRMYSALRRSGAIVRAVAGERCSSAALWPLLAADIRQCRASTVFQVHQAARTAAPGIVRRGTAPEYKALATSLAVADRRFLDVLCARTGAAREKMQAEMAHERPMNAGSAFSAGIVHEIVGLNRLDPTLPERMAPPGLFAGHAAARAAGRPGLLLGVPSVKFSPAYLAACDIARFR